jgi:hypothetical protein
VITILQAANSNSKLSWKAPQTFPPAAPSFFSNLLFLCCTLPRDMSLIRLRAAASVGALVVVLVVVLGVADSLVSARAIPNVWKQRHDVLPHHSMRVPLTFALHQRNLKAFEVCVLSLSLSLSLSLM